jgi:hypothetical protein
MFKILVLQTFLNLADEQLEYLIRNPGLSFTRFPEAPARVPGAGRHLPIHRA